MRLLEQMGEIVGRRPRIGGRDDVVDIAPFLRPEIAEQVGADRPVRGLDGVAVAAVQSGAGEAVQLDVERPHLVPEPLGQRGEFVGAHVVFGAPHRAGVGIAELAGAGIGDLDHPLIFGRIGPPTLLFQLVHISWSWAGSRTVPIRASISLPVRVSPAIVPRPRPYCEERSVEIRFISAAAPGVVGAARMRPLRSRFSLRRVSALSPGHVLVARRLAGQADAHFGADRAEIGGERVGVLGDVGRVDPGGRGC